MTTLYSMHGHGAPEPIGLEYIAAALTKSEFTCFFYSRNEMQVSSTGCNRTISFFSAVTPEYLEIGKAAHAAKKRGNVTVLGGYHACGCQGDVVSDMFDYIVVGEGEEVATAIAEAHIQGDWDALNRFQSQTVGSVRVVRAPRINDLDTLPLPLRSEERLARYHIYDLMWPPASCQKNAALVLGSRGCSHECDFCASSSVWGRGVRLRSTEKIVQELQDLVLRFGTNTVVFIDQSLGQNKQWALNLCESVQKASLGIHWYHQSNLSIDRDVVRAMAEAGCTKIGFGLEGISPQAVSMIKPVNSGDLDSVNSLFDYCNSLGVFVKVYLMLGFPWETDEIIAGYMEWITRIRANEVKISYFTPFPGTRDWEKYQGQLASRDWVDFDTVRMPVVHNPRISVSQYHKIRTALFKSFYGSSTYSEVTNQMIRTYPHYIESYREFVNYLRQFDMVSNNARWLGRLPLEQSPRFVSTGDCVK